VKTAIVKYTLVFFMLIGVVIVPKAVLGVPGISIKVGEVMVKWIPLQLRILLQVGVLGGREVSRGEVV